MSRSSVLACQGPSASLTSFGAPAGSESTPGASGSGAARTVGDLSLDAPSGGAAVLPRGPRSRGRATVCDRLKASVGLQTRKAALAGGF